MEGWVRFHRRYLDSDLWLSEPFTKGQAWVDLFSLANHKDGFIRIRGNRVEVKRGQVGWSQLKLSERWKWSRGKVRRFLDELENIDGKVVQQKTKVTTLINIINYELYQTGDTTDSTADGQQTDNRQYTNKNDKNVNNDNKTRKKIKKKSFFPPTKDQVIRYFIDNEYDANKGAEAFEFYHCADWHDSRGNKVKNWKQKMRGVWFKDDNRVNNVHTPKNNNRLTRSERNAQEMSNFINGEV